ncbi:MAG: kinase-like domain-containing protein, partial [Piptocephalis tieghemiana]
MPSIAPRNKGSRPARPAPPGAPGTAPVARREERRGGSSTSSKPAKVWVPPPKEIVDRRTKARYTTGDLLGEGGFARVYHAMDERGSKLAVKVVPKTSLKNHKTKNKLLSEIDIHRSMRHRHIVRFHAVFEDDENVYMILELCENKSLMDMLKRRKRMSEPEARYFFWQILDATRYMHDHRVIHRDLKLGNVFLSREMNVKIGDFGLAALLEDDEERKKTICGTPNYIAPEILFDTEKGHSYEVDAWSLGVILFTMMCGRPPFQTKNVKEIYKKIKENVFEFPHDLQVSPDAQSLVRALLCKVPESRLSTAEIIDHPFFTRGYH